MVDVNALAFFCFASSVYATARAHRLCIHVSIQLFLGTSDIRHVFLLLIIIHFALDLHNGSVTARSS